MQWERVPPDTYLFALRDGVLPEYLEVLQALERDTMFVFEQQIEKPPARPTEATEPLLWTLESWISSPAQLVVRPGPRRSLSKIPGFEPVDELSSLDVARTRLKDLIAGAIEEAGLILDEPGGLSLAFLIDGTLRTLEAWRLDRSSIPRWHLPAYSWPRRDPRGAPDDHTMPVRLRVDKAFERSVDEVQLPSLPDPEAVALVDEIHEEIFAVAQALVVLRALGRHSEAQARVAALLKLGSELMTGPMSVPRRREKEVMLSQWLQELRGIECRTGEAEGVVQAAGLTLRSHGTDATVPTGRRGKREELFSALAEILYKQMWERLYQYRWHEPDRKDAFPRKKPHKRPDIPALVRAGGVLSLIYPIESLAVRGQRNPSETRLYQSVMHSCYGKGNKTKPPLR